MLRLLKPGMLTSIQQHLYKAKSNGHLLDIYKTAEEVRLEHINDNVAREDIIEKLIFFAGTMAIKFDRESLEDQSVIPFVSARDATAEGSV